MNVALLIRLREAGGAFVDVDALGGDPAAVHRDLDELSAFGFGLERHPYRGAAYRGPSDRLCPDLIERGSTPRWVGRRVAVWEHVGSTNDLAARASSSRANAGLVVLAESQSDGRGRRGRRWVAPPRSSILFSALLFPPPELDIPGWLTALGAVAVAGLAEDLTGAVARIKWPNDVRVDGRKLAGILVERGAGGGAIVGIGLNANLEPAELPEELRDSVTSLSRLLGRRVDRSEVARDLIGRLDALYGDAIELGPGPLDRAWRGRSEHVGRVVLVQTPGGARVGTLADLGLLRGAEVVDAEGEVMVIPTAEIRSIGDPGQVSRDEV